VNYYYEFVLSLGFVTFMAAYSFRKTNILLDKCIFHQDIVTSHTALLMKVILAKKQIPVLENPPCSPFVVAFYFSCFFVIENICERVLF
jgi:hypothetical protein